MQTASYELYQELQKNTEVKLIKWGGSMKYLPIIYPWLFIRGLLASIIWKPDVVYLQDGVMAPIGWLLKKLAQRKTLITVHGLEVTYQNRIYRSLVMPFIRLQDRVITVSEGTKQTVQENVDVNSGVINNGVVDQFYRENLDKDKLNNQLLDEGYVLPDMAKKKILHTHGRLVKRKGVAWLVSNVLPLLVKNDKNIVYLISGTGAASENIHKTIARMKLQDHAFMLGRVSDDLLIKIYNSIDLFIAPNIEVEGDLEGFGIVAVEASSCGNTVITSDIEGLKDAVINGKNGFRLPAEDIQKYVSKIKQELDNPSLKKSAVRSFTLKEYSWANAAQKYLDEFKQL